MNYKLRIITALLLIFSVISSYAAEKPLTSGWWSYVDGSTTTISLASQNPVVANVNVTGVPTGSPRVVVNVSGEDWRKYTKLVFDAKLESTASCILTEGKDITPILVAEDTKENTMGVVTAAQWHYMSVFHINAGGSVQTVELDLSQMSRKRVSQFILFLADAPCTASHSYKITFSNVRLVGADDNVLVFDGADFSTQTMPAASGSAFSSLETTDGLKLDITSAGAVSSVSLGGAQVGAGAGGIMLYDAKTTQAPVLAQGTITAITDGVRQQASVSALNLNLDAEYKNLGDRILVSGTVTSTNNEERAVTVYVAFPISENTNWEFHKSLLHKTAIFTEMASMPQLEEVCTDYPLAVLADAATGNGLALLIDQTKPVAYRLVGNPKQKLFYAAFDFALLNQNRFDGTSQKSADFQIEIIRTAGKWGFRAGLDKLYTIHADWYTDKIGYGGGWELWERSNFNYTNAQNIAGGYRFDWNGSGNSKTLWEQNVKNNFLNFLYIESQYTQFSLTDFAAPSAALAAERLDKLVAGDAAEWAQFLTLSYTKGYCGTIHPKATPLRPFLDTVLTAAKVSAMHDRNGNIMWNIADRPWIGGIGAMVPCNLSPNIPGGRGPVMRQMGMDPYWDEYLANGWSAPNGFALDEFMMAPADYRRENFQYMETPLAFDRITKQPMIAAGFSAVEWIKKLHDDYAAQSRKLLLFANCKGSMTFAAPYLSIFGVEDHYPQQPDLFRVLAGKKRGLTNVAYTPPAPVLKNLEYHYLLWCFYVGRNATVEMLTPLVKMADKLYAAGWEPITGATASPSAIRMERYGDINSDTIYLSVHNTATGVQSVNIIFDTDFVGERTKAEWVYNGSGTLNFGADHKISFTLGDRETKVVMLSKSKYAIVWEQNLDLTYGDADVRLTAASENTDLSISYTSDKPNIAEIVGGNKLRIKHAGVVNITAAQAATDLVSGAQVTQTAIIKKKAMMVTPVNNYKRAGATDPALSFTYAEDALEAGDAFAGNVSREAGESVGHYAILQGTLALSADYLIKFTPGFFLLRMPPQVP